MDLEAIKLTLDALIAISVLAMGALDPYLLSKG